jgi:histone-lysine N-methyltransferase SETD3
MADMLNHKRPEETSWTYDQTKGAFTIVTTKALSKGAQIFDSYGRKCNSRYFVNYGFSLDNNEDNQVAMFFSVPRSDPLYQLKAKLVGANERRYQIPFEHKERVTRKCMTFLRVICATAEELEPLIKAPSLVKIDPISIRNEAAVMRMVAKEAENVLNGFETTLEEDNKLLETNLTMNIRNCVLMRRGEKEILHAYMDLAERINQVEQYELKTLEEYLVAEVYGKGPKPSIEWRREMYFREIWIPLLTGVKMELEEMNNSLGE